MTYQLTIAIDDAAEALEFVAMCNHDDGIRLVHCYLQPEEADLDLEPEFDGLVHIAVAIEPVKAKPAKRYRYVTDVACPACRAKASERCHSISNGNPWSGYTYGHRARHHALEEARNETPDV
jgi:hypothetical protein